MKKLTAILLVVLLIIFSSNNILSVAAADGAGNAINPAKAELAKDALKNYADGMTNDYSSEDFTFVYFGEYCDYAVCYGGYVFENPWEMVATIGNYEFSLFSDAQYEKHFLPLYLIKGEDVILLEDAYKNNMISESDLDNIVDMIQLTPVKYFSVHNTEKNPAKTELAKDALKNYADGVTNDYSPEDFTFVYFGEYCDYAVCYGGYVFENPWEMVATIGNYEFSLFSDAQYEKHFLPLYLIKGEDVILLEDAYKNNIISESDLDNIVDMIQLTSAKYFSVHNTEKNPAKTELAKDALKNYADGMTNDYSSEDFTFVYFGEYCDYAVCYGGYVFENPWEMVATIGSYEFSLFSDAQYEKHFLPLYLIKGEDVILLEDAYKNNIISESDLDNIVDMIQLTSAKYFSVHNTEKNPAKTELAKDALKNYADGMTNDYSSEDFTFVYFGEYCDYAVCYGGYVFENPWEMAATIGNYEFSLFSDAQYEKHYLPLYLIKGEDVILLEDAYKNNMISESDLDNIVDMIQLTPVKYFRVSVYDDELIEKDLNSDLLYEEIFFERYAPNMSADIRKHCTYNETYYHIGENGNLDWALINADLSGGLAESVLVYIYMTTRVIIWPYHSGSPFHINYAVYDVEADKFVDLVDVAKDTSKYPEIEDVLDELKIGYPYGDADLDGELTIFDATIIQRYLAKLTQFKEDCCDIDRDGEITILDATTIQMKLAKLEGSLIS